jgi:F-type H+-transporting ATPase subunit gamma
MASLRDIKRRIGSVQSTQQITKAMQMVAAAKLRRAQQRVASARPYAQKMQDMLQSLATAASGLNNPLFEERAPRKEALVLFTSDRGLCGSYNANLIRRASQFLKEKGASESLLIPVGKKGFDWFKSRPYPMGDTFLDWQGNLDFERVKGITRYLVELFESEQVDRVHLLYTQFISTVSYRVAFEQFLPIVPPTQEDADVGADDYIFEPSPDAIFNRLLPSYAVTRVQTALAEALASEHGARMFAMSNATKNAGEMIESLTLVYNKARQASITTEMLEIVGGAEALR